MYESQDFDIDQRKSDDENTILALDWVLNNWQITGTKKDEEISQEPLNKYD